jgi:hypothetical protein
LHLDGLAPDEITGSDFRSVVGRTLGWQHLKSTAFELSHGGDRYRFDGRGYGHGVGMCVMGSVRLAASGQTAPQILARYFPGLPIGTLPSGAPPPVVPIERAAVSSAAVLTDVALTLPDDDEGERGVIAQLTLRARDEVARQLGVAPPPRVTLRVHATTTAYERATGQPWFTTGAVVGGDVHLLPLAVLRERGVLEQTIRRELVHMMADPALERRPAWVREGAALYFAGRRPAGEREPSSPFRPQPRLECPSDADLLQPVSVGALSNASARALACFSRQLQNGKSWREVK